jgi:TRAP transporter TAXI family solute receptor
MNFRKGVLLIILFIFSVGQVYCQMIILSGPEKGSYNHFAGDISALLGENNGILLENQTSGGSASNFNLLTDPNANYKIALIQSDYLNLMKAEDKLNDTDKAGSLKVVMQLATEQIHLVAKISSGLTSLQDLDSKRVGIGNEEQGGFATSKIIKARSQIGWTAVYIGFNEMLNRLSSGSIDAGLVVGSAPLEMLDIDPQVMIDEITLLELDDFNGWAKHYENDTIYSDDYKWLDKNIPTFGVRTLLVVNESKLTSEDQQTVSVIKSSIVQNLDQLRSQGHPKWRTVIIPDEPIAEIGKNAVVTKTTDPLTVDSKDEITYRVQIYSRNYKREDVQITINGKSYNSYVYSYLDAYRYTIGEFTSLSDAAELQYSCRKSGYSQAFVATFINNIRSIDPDHYK